MGCCNRDKMVTALKGGRDMECSAATSQVQENVYG